MTKRIILVLLASLFTVTALAAPVVYPTNKDGSIITGVLTAGFDPLAMVGDSPVVPFPFNMLFLDLETFQPAGDLTLVIPVDDPEDFSNPGAALGTTDGFSTTEKWFVDFVQAEDGTGTGRDPGNIDFGSVVAGHSVRLFEVDVTGYLTVNSVVRELVPNVDYMAVYVGGGTLVIFPLKPLKEMTNYMAVLTNDIKDTQGNDATADTMYHLLQQQTPWVDENGHSTYSLVPDDLAQLLEGFRPYVNSWEDAAESAGVVREDIILSWPVQTQSITPVLKQLRSIARPSPTTVGPTGMDTSALGGLGMADIYAGIITIPYYLGVPSAENPVAPLTDFWKAAPGAYIPPFDALLTDETSTNVTVANPFPVVTSMQIVPLLMTVPNESSGMTRPAAGWPVVIYGHGVTRARTDMLAIADTAARAGYAVIAIDSPLHGVAPDSPLYVKNVFPHANERTFDVDYINNATGAPGPDGIADPTGAHFMNLGSSLTTRDNLRQGETDLSILAVSIPSISYDGDALADLDGSTIQFVGQSMGSIMGTAFVAVEPTVTNAFLSVPAGGLARALEASDEFGPVIRAGLEALAGLVPGSADYEQFFLFLQSVIDSADPINWSAEAARYNNIVLHEVIGDTVLPNYVPTAPLSGTEPMIATMGLTSYSTTQSSPAGLDIAGRFVPPAHHGSILTPAGAPETFLEMQGQLATFLATRGTTVVVANEATMVPVVAMEMGSSSGLKENSKSGKNKGGKTVKPPAQPGESNGIQSGKSKPTVKARAGELK